MNVKIFTVDKKTGKETLVREAQNLVVNSGLNVIKTTCFYIRSYYDEAKYCAVGTDNTAPAAGQTGLVSEVERELYDTSVAGSTGVWVSTFYIDFSSSLTIQEAGLFETSGSSYMVARTTFTGIPVSTTTGLKIIWTFTIARAP